MKKNCDLFIMEKQNKNFFKDCCLYAEKLSENSPKTCAKQIWQGLTVNVCHSWHWRRYKKDQFCSLPHTLQFYIYKCCTLLLCWMTSHLSLEEFKVFRRNSKNLSIHQELKIEMKKRSKSLDSSQSEIWGKMQKKQWLI